MTVKEYLNGHFEIEPDYIEGKLIPRFGGGLSHGRTKVRIGAWFERRRRHLGLTPYMSVHLRISANRFRVVDVCVVTKDEGDEEFLTTPPFLCIEVVSEDEPFSVLLGRLNDYRRLGAENIWVVSPGLRAGWRVGPDGSWTPCPRSMSTSDGAISVPLGSLFSSPPSTPAATPSADRARSD